MAITPDTIIEALDPEDLFALVVPGGWAPDKLRRYAVVTDLVRSMDAAGKPLGIICHGGLVAISAGIVKGRRATGSLGIKDDLVNAGATWVDEAALRDRNVVWGRIVADIPAFCQELISALQSIPPGN
jgi:protease I